MPRIQLKHVVSFSSEDPKNPADNLLKPEDYYKWKCATPGESRCVVELQFEKATKIHSVDIGNNGSAFIEILVGRSSWEPSQDYKVLLAASSFMSPSESKSGTATFRVRMFGPDKLVKSVAAEKWDRVKIACTQPYNKAECYGLSFVTFHSPPEEEAEVEKDKDAKTLNFKKKIGKFTLKDESDVDEMQIGSYFARKMQHGTLPVSASSAASARDASSSIRLNTMTSKPSTSSGSILASVRKADQPTSLEPKERQPTIPKQVALKSGSSDSKGHDSALQPSSNMGQLNEFKNGKKNEEPQMGISKQEGSKRKFQETKACSDVIQQKGEELAPPTKKVKRRMKNRKLPFHRIMRNVVFVLSGYKNPQRGDLRQQAISMGAQYRPDWDSECTHLICAFKNTPKYNQVLGQGKIVTHKWITDCAKKRERISIKSYRIDGGASSSDSDPDSESNDGNSTGMKDSYIVLSTGTTKDNPSQTEMEQPIPGPSHATEELEGDEYDTEDELQKVREDISCRTENKKGHLDDAEDDDDEYGGSTEDESDSDSKDEHAALVPSKEQNKHEAVLSNLPPLPNYFNHDSFLIYGDFEPTERRRLVRYITAYNGVVCEYMNDNVHYVVSDKDWDGTFDETAASNSSLEFIRPSWIITCHEEGKRVSPNDFQIERP